MGNLRQTQGADLSGGFPCHCRAHEEVPKRVRRYIPLCDVLLDCLLQSGNLLVQTSAPVQI